ncbi:spore germination protein [Cohnella luojiensis]|uniref:Spore germination protein n=1 Tax=Cohnella luojiensis TaxID=652876 RepID=A0A4Y8LZ96_9BACL|nr:spore germination protein [Cohnella luojiensis]TFE26271.1 spore germination protein [Cohnella luojiensis]
MDNDKATTRGEGSILVRKGTGKLIVDQIAERLGQSPDFICQQLEINAEFGVYCIYISSIVTTNQVDEMLLRPIVEDYQLAEASLKNPIDWLIKIIPRAQQKKLSGFAEGINDLLEGHCLLIPTSGEIYLSYDVSKGEYRNIAEPDTEASIRGPREGFVEAITWNSALIRKRLKDEHLVFESLVIGSKTRTRVYLTYLNNVASVQVVDEFRRRLLSIQTDSILESAYIEEWIQDTTLSPFPQLISTERPDSIVAKLLEGQIAVMTDGTPMVLVGPITFFQLFSSPEDYYQRADIATLSRWLRMFAFLLSIFTPALYIAVVSYHQELLPTNLLISLAAQREEVPFPAFIEAFIMTVTFEILREAGLRMPRIAGQSISIVGALVLGQAAVEAGLVSAAMVIVVSLTAISNFVSPNYSFGIAQRIIQFSFMLLSGLMGLFGLMCGVFFLLIHLVSIRSFGVKYFTPFAPVVLADWKDTMVRVPRNMMKRLPRESLAKRKRR